MSHGVHGRVSHIPAREVSARVIELDGRLVAEVSGTVRETDVYGADLVLHRRLRFPMGEPRRRDRRRGREPGPCPGRRHAPVPRERRLPGRGARRACCSRPTPRSSPRDAPAAALLAEHADLPAAAGRFRAARLRASAARAGRRSREHRDREPVVGADRRDRRSSSTTTRASCRICGSGGCSRRACT